MSLVQRIVLRLMPGRAAEIERESRSWILTCPSCGHERSYWEIGGVRFKAASAGKGPPRMPSVRREGNARRRAAAL